MLEPRPPWPHAPTHQLSARGTYFVTASTHLKTHHFRGKDRLRVLHRGWLRLARLNYVHQNAVKHGLVPVANQYPWGSARWFERSASAAMGNSIYRFKIDRLQVADDFEPAPEW